MTLTVSNDVSITVRAVPKKLVPACKNLATCQVYLDSSGLRFDKVQRAKGGHSEENNEGDALLTVGRPNQGSTFCRSLEVLKGDQEMRLTDLQNGVTGFEAPCRMAPTSQTLRSGSFEIKPSLSQVMKEARPVRDVLIEIFRMGPTQVLAPAPIVEKTTVSPSRRRSGKVTLWDELT
ncbi:MAG: hypothetical protein ACE5JS_03265 [Nitrospinota bacterium]